MDSLSLSGSADDNRLHRRDLVFLSVLCTLLYGNTLVEPRVLSTHETVHCQNVREMFISGDFLIPTYGGRPWLERPPLPHWITGVFAALAGDNKAEWTMRLGSIFAAVVAVFAFAWAVAGCLGRTIGTMSGAILATSREFSAYATAPEADIFLASAVTIVGSLFLRVRFGPRPAMERCSFFGGRSGSIVLFFLLLGLTNWMKGPLFGMIFVLVPLAGYLVWNRSLRELRPFVWFWGWLILIAAGVAWPYIAYQRYPDIVDLWMIDYGVRWQSGYLGEPFWYYFVQQPWNFFPWSIAVLTGLVVTAKTVFRGEAQPLRFLWCWAVLPVLFFSLFKGKHHHYMLSCLAPGAALAAFGAASVWRWLKSWPNWLRRPWFWLALAGLPVAVVIVEFGKWIAGPIWVRWTIACGWPIVLTVSLWVGAHRNGRIAFAGFCAIIVVVNAFFYMHRSRYLNSYEGDLVFVEQVKAQASNERPLLVVCDKHPLTSSWLLFYLGKDAHLLHNKTFLRDDRLTTPVVNIVCRRGDVPALAEYGVAQTLLESSRTRAEQSPEDRWVLCQLKFHPDLARSPGNVRISPLQATGRALGPYLGKSVLTRQQSLSADSQSTF